MTRDECLGAVSSAFGGVRAWAGIGFWNIHLDSTPPREVVLMSRFVEANVSGSGMTPDALTSHLKGISAAEWATTAQGGLLLVLR